MWFDSLLDFLPSISAPAILIIAGVLLCLPGLGIQVRGIRVSERFKKRPALGIGAAMLLLGVAIELLTIFRTSSGDSSKPSDTVAQRVTIEERTVLPVADHLTVDETETKVRTLLEENVTNKVHMFIEAWTAMPSPHDELPKELITQARQHLSKPEVNVESQTLFGKKMIVVGHATLHVSLHAFQAGLVKAHQRYLRSAPSTDVQATVPTANVGTHGQSNVQTKLPQETFGAHGFP